MEKSTAREGVLYVVATPIGNLEDITLRALEVLRSVDLILAEDTRVSARLLRRFAIATPLKAFHEHNEQRMTPWVIHRLDNGASIALISDAGTPLVRDPGFHLTRTLRERGVQGAKVVPIPGPSALVCALSVAGLPADRFVFEGFLPVKRGARRSRLRELAQETRTVVLYEAPHRILATIDDMTELFGHQRHAVIARELTKTFETIHAGDFSMIANRLREDTNQQRGEFVVLVEGKSKQIPGDGAFATADGERPEEGATEEDLRVLRLLMEELPLKKAVLLAARITGRKRNALYRIALGK